MRMVWSRWGYLWNDEGAISSKFVVFVFCFFLYVCVFVMCFLLLLLIFFFFFFLLFLSLVVASQAGSVQFSSRWYLCAWKIPYALHPICQKFPQLCLWNGSNVRLIDLSSFQGRSSSAFSFHAYLFEAIDGVMSFVFCSQLGSVSSFSTLQILAYERNMNIEKTCILTLKLFMSVQCYHTVILTQKLFMSVQCYHTVILTQKLFMSVQCYHTVNYYYFL